MGDTIAQTRFENVSKLSNDSMLVRGNTLQSDEDRLTLIELMELCAFLQKKVLDLENIKTTQANEIASLKRRVTKLEQKKRSRTYELKRLRKVGATARVESSGDEENLGEDASKQERRINAIDADEDITLVSVQDDADKEMFDVGTLNGEEVFVAGKNENVVEEVVNAAQVSTAATTVTITTEEITFAQALADLNSTKPKAKGIAFREPGQRERNLVEPKKPLKKKDQLKLDEEIAFKLKAEINEEEIIARAEEEKIDEANIALTKEWDDIQAKFKADHEMAQRLQAGEQEELSIEEKAKLFQQLLEKRRKHFAAKRAEEQRNKPPTQAQQRKIIAFKRVNTFVDFRTDLVEGSSKRAGEELEQESTEKQKVVDNKDPTKLQSLMKVIPDEEDVAIDVVPLATKPPTIVDWKIHKEGKKSYYQIVRADGKRGRRIVGIKSLLNAASITAALIDVNAAQSKLVLLENFNENYFKCLRLLYKVNAAEGVNVASEEVSTVELVSTAYLNANCSTIMLNKIPEKMGDSGPFTFPCGLENNTVKQALVNLGASINMMPYSLFEKLAPKELTPTIMSIRLADHTYRYPKGIAEDMLVRVGKFIFPTDFVILNMDEVVQVPIILGRPFLITLKALIDVFDKKVTLRVGNESMVFNLLESMKHPKESDDTLYYVEGFENIFENENFQEVETTGCIKPPWIEAYNLGDDDFKRKEEVLAIDSPLITKVEKLPQDDTFNLKPSIEDPPSIELKYLPSHLEYAFLAEDSKLLEDYKPVVQHQRRVNPNIKEVVKKGVVKLLNAGLIYPISDSPWVSPVKVVPKKGGMTVVMNEKNEPMPTRTVTGWRVCIDYRKLNDATRKDHFLLPFIDQMLERLAGNEFYCFLDGSPVTSKFQ
ncbi:putative ribonuclease H-like domain-containing protein [Tanacetum coccineum]